MDLRKPLILRLCFTQANLSAFFAYLRAVIHLSHPTSGDEAF